MKKLKIWQWGIVGCGGVILLCTASVLLGYAFQERPPERSFKIEELLIDESAFPSGWKVSEGPYSHRGQAPLGGGPDHLQYRVLYFRPEKTTTNIGAFEEIYRFASSNKAAQEFEESLPFEFRTGEHWSPWEIPKGFSYSSPHAQHFYAACARESWETTTTEFCRMLGQYEEYVVLFSTKISPSYMTYEDFEKVVRAIDERMGRYLSKAPKRSAP